MIHPQDDFQTTARQFLRALFMVIFEFLAPCSKGHVSRNSSSGYRRGRQLGDVGDFSPPFLFSSFHGRRRLRLLPGHAFSTGGAMSLWIIAASILEPFIYHPLIAFSLVSQPPHVPRDLEWGQMTRKGFSQRDAAAMYDGQAERFPLGWWEDTPGNDHC